VGSTGATAEVYTHGAHLSSWKTADGVEQIFISSDVRYTPPSSIILIVTPNSPLVGAHIPKTDPRVPPSPRSQVVFKPPKAIRGGVPICFPQFSDFGPLGQHGFARNETWEVR
jgi:glucose-6-phosphate 1-epimerase